MSKADLISLIEKNIISPKKSQKKKWSHLRKNRHEVQWAWEEIHGRKYKWQIKMLKIFNLTSDQEIPRKIAMRYCFSGIKLPKIKNTLFLQRYNGQSLLSPSWWKYKLVRPFWKIVWQCVSQALKCSWVLSRKFPLLKNLGYT